MEKTELSKPMTVSSKYQITVPEHVRSWMDIKANDKVIFTTNGNEVFFEKYVSKEENHLKLVTYARSLLHTGAPVFITGDIAKGKSKLAKEIGSYGFGDVIYIAPSVEVGEDAAIEKLNYALDCFGSPEKLLIVDEYSFFSKSGIFKLDETFYEKFKGSLIVVSQEQSQLDLPPIYKHSISYSIHINDLVNEMDYKIVQHLAPTRPSNEVIHTDVSVNLSLPNAITSWGAIEYLKDSINAMSTEKYFKGQQHNAIHHLEINLYGKEIFTVKMLGDLIDAIVSDHSINPEKLGEIRHLGIVFTGIKTIFKDYLNFPFVNEIVAVGPTIPNTQNLTPFQESDWNEYKGD